MSTLAEPVGLGSITARNRFVFGPHVTNLARRRAVSGRHVAYYRRRAAGGAGIVVIEEASVHASDWPYERSPLAAESAEGWSAVAAACREEGAVTIAAIGHTGGQGSSAYHQQVLLAPSSVPDVATREVPKAMEAADVAAVVEGFAAAASLAHACGCAGVEVNAGQWSLLRQFCSGLTNLRDDELGAGDRSALLRAVLAAVRAASLGVVGLRLSCDELAPWAGLVPATAAALLRPLAGDGLFDYVTVVRGSAYGTGATSPDGHEHPGFNREATGEVRAALPAGVAVVAQGSIVEQDMAAEIVESGEADLVEVTRAFIADASFARKVLHPGAGAARPCTLCNQACQVRDPRNPLVSCIADPASGHEWEGEACDAPAGRRDGETPAGRRLLVVGGGPAGLECARLAALGGMSVTLCERTAAFGGMIAVATRLPGRERLARFAEWLEAECRRSGVALESGHEVSLEEIDAHDGPVVCCTGSRPGRRTYVVQPPALVLTAAELLSAERLVGEMPPSPAVVLDPVGGPVGVGVAELLASLGAGVTLVTPDFVAGEQLARTGDLAPANVRLRRAGVTIARRCVVTSVGPDGVVVEGVDAGTARTVAAALLVDAGHRLPDDTLYRAAEASTGGGRPDLLVAGDAVAPRTILEAVLEGRRAAALLLASLTAGAS